MDNEYVNDHKPSLLDRKLLEMIVHAAEGEAAATKYYSRLSQMMTDEKDRKTVHDIALDEAKHRRLFDELYYNISGARIPPFEHFNEPTEPAGTFLEIFEERLYDELHDAEFYRQIYFALINMDYRDVLFEIITDEKRHAQLMSFLYAKYK